MSSLSSLSCRNVHVAIMSVLRSLANGLTNKDHMTRNVVKDSRESPDKQQTGVLNRLAYLKSLLRSILHVDIISSIQEFH